MARSPKGGAAQVVQLGKGLPCRHENLSLGPKLSMEVHVGHPGAGVLGMGTEMGGLTGCQQASTRFSDRQTLSQKIKTEGWK